MTNLTNPLDKEKVLVTLVEPNKDAWKPAKPKEDADEYEKAEYNEAIKKVLKRKDTYDENKYKVFSIVLGQCSEALQAKLREQDEWEKMFGKGPHKPHEVY